MNIFNIHDLFAIEIEDGLEDTNKIYQFLSSINKGNSRTLKNKIIISKIEIFNLDNHRLYSDNIYISSHSLIDNNYGIEIIIDENNIYLKTKYRFIEWLMYSIQLMLLKLDCVLIHGAAVSKDKEAIILPSWGGVGKTAILNDFVKKLDYKVIGDDLFILKHNGEIFSFPKPMVLYPYHRILFPEIFKNHINIIPVKFTGFVSRLVPRIKKLLSPFPKFLNFVRNNNPQLYWALPSEVFGKEKIEDYSKIKYAFWLERSKEPTNINYVNNKLESQILGSTINEFDQRVVFCANVLLGLGILDNNNYLIKWSNLLESGLRNAKTGRININIDVKIQNVGTEIERLLNNEL